MIQSERMNIREATPDDVGIVIDLENHKDNRDNLWQGTYEEHLDEIHDPEHLLLVFCRKGDDEIIGFALIHVDSKSKLFEIRRIAISDKGKGYGREAMVALIDYAFNTLDTNKVWLDVYPHNTTGIKLYESLGMHKDGLLRDNYYSDHQGFLDQAVYSLLRREYEAQ